MTLKRTEARKCKLSMECKYLQEHEKCIHRLKENVFTQYEMLLETLNISAKYLRVLGYSKQCPTKAIMHQE